MVTNPVSRHPGVVASAAASLDALSGGRLVLGLGAGGGPLFSMGLSVPKRPELRQATATIRSLLASEPSETATGEAIAGRTPIGGPLIRQRSQLAEQADRGTGRAGSNHLPRPWRLGRSTPLDRLSP